MARNVLKGLYYIRGLVWALCKTRKDHKCWECDDECMKGTMMYRPQTNSNDRMRRICIHCMGILAEKG
jgi:hypothetical protein